MSHSDRINPGKPFRPNAKNNKEFRPLYQFAGNRHFLPAARRQVLDRRGKREVQFQLLLYLSGAPHNLALIQKDFRPGLGNFIEKKVLHDRHAEYDAIVNILMHGGDARVAGLIRKPEVAFLAFNDDMSGGRPVNACKRLDQG